jgi:hypothetical protein
MLGYWPLQSNTNLLLHGIWETEDTSIEPEDEMSRACSIHEEKRNAYRILTGKPEGRRSLRRPGHRWEDNINGS